MNDRDLMFKRNGVARLLEFTDKMHRNCIRVNTGNTINHELAKFLVCWDLKKEGKEFYTEAIFLHHNGRADIVCLDDAEAIEILESETIEEAKRKMSLYPLKIRFVKAEEILKRMLK